MSSKVSKAEREAAKQSLARLSSFPGVAPFVLFGAALELAEPEATTTTETKLGAREFVGMTAVYGNEFLYLDRREWEIRTAICEPGMFAESVAEINGRTGLGKGNIPVMWEHYSLMGRTVALEELPTGLRVHGRITDEPTALSRYSHVLAGAARGMSVGFDIVSKTIETDEDGEELHRITKGRLMESTLCLWGANPLASVLDVAASAANASRVSLSHESIRELVAELARLTKAGGSAPANQSDQILAELRLERARIDTLMVLAGL